MGKMTKVEKVARIREALRLAATNGYTFAKYSPVVADFRLECTNCKDTTVARKFTTEQLDVIAATIISDMGIAK